MKTARTLCAALFAVLAVSSCSSDGDGGNAVPRGWIGDTYSAAGTDYLDPSDAPSAVADEIDGNTAATGRVVGDGTVLLRYRDDIVAVSPGQGGSRIEIDDYRTGYDRWERYVGDEWPDPDDDDDDFRGGGPGSGK